MIFHLCRSKVIVALVQRTSTGGVRFRIVSARHAVHCSRVYVGITPFSVSAGAVLLSRVARLRYDPGRSIKCVRIGCNCCGHRQQLGREFCGSGERHSQLSSRELNAGGQFLSCGAGVWIRAARIHYAGELGNSDRGGFQALKKGRAANGHGVPNLHPFQTHHQLPRAPLAHTEDAPDGAAVEVFSVKDAHFREDGVKSGEPKRLRRHGVAHGYFKLLQRSGTILTLDINGVLAVDRRSWSRLTRTIVPRSGTRPRLRERTSSRASDPRSARPRCPASRPAAGRATTPPRRSSSGSRES